MLCDADLSQVSSTLPRGHLGRPFHGLSPFLTQPPFCHTASCGQNKSVRWFPTQNCIGYFCGKCH